MATMSQTLVGASSASAEWKAIKWQKAQKQVRRLQMRIAKATREGHHGKAKALQWILTHSFYTKCLAVERVVSNKGGRTPGVDNVTWETPRQKIQAVKTLKRRGYQPKPLRRVYIPKRNGKRRPLGIPTIKDRAIQALYWFGLEPIAETQADRNSYGFRSQRSTADAIEQCFNCLSRKASSQWILEGDIESCFDQISHEWLMENIPLDKTILCKWLKAGYLEEGLYHLLKAGTPQGGIVSPTLANMALDGLEKELNHFSKSSKVNLVRYADDFVITGDSKTFLGQQVYPLVEAFLAKRGLKLSKEKTQITFIEDGFDFLGFNVRKYGGKLLIKPSKKNVRDFLTHIRKLIRSNQSVKTEELIAILNPKIRGWANYFRHVVSKKTFVYVDNRIFNALFKWIYRRHPEKSFHWRRKKYFRQEGFRQWIFCARILNKQGEARWLDLVSASKVAIQRHVKIKAQANPYDPEWKAYFEQRKRQPQLRLGKRAVSFGEHVEVDTALPGLRWL